MAEAEGYFFAQFSDLKEDREWLGVSGTYQIATENEPSPHGYREG
jgi:hypothetical protein